MKFILETNRLRLRELNSSDAEFMFYLLNDPSFIENIGNRNIQKRSDAAKYIETAAMKSYNINQFGLWLVETKDSHQAIGINGLIKREGFKDVDIGFAFLPAYCSKGYALESSLGIINYAKYKLRLSKLIGITKPTNTRSIKLLGKVGMQFERWLEMGDEINKVFFLNLN